MLVSIPSKFPPLPGRRDRRTIAIVYRTKCLLIEGIFLAVVLQLHAAALSSLRSEVAELNARLVAETRAREATEAALVRAELQAARAEQKVEQQAARHEERLTELHSVIAELGRQLERHRATVIAEEDESGKGEKREPIPSTCATTVSISRTEIYYEPSLFDILTRFPLRGHPFVPLNTWPKYTRSPKEMILVQALHTFYQFVSIFP